MAEPTLIVPPSGPVTAHCLRLQPGDHLMPSLKQAASIILSHIPKEQCGSAFVITAVGSLQDVTIRLANASRTDTTTTKKDEKAKANANNDIKKYTNKRFEIVSLTGTFSRNDGCHVHICLADAEGNAVGGHLIDGVIFTTCELVLGTASGVEFTREMDGATGYNELVVRQILPTKSSSAGTTTSSSVLWGTVAKTLLAVTLLGIVCGKARSR